MKHATQPFTWHPVYERNKLVYYELCVRLGELGIWLTAEEDAWHIEEGGGARVLRGTATSYEDAREQAAEHFLLLLGDARTRLKRATVSDFPRNLPAPKSSPRCKKSA